MRDEDDVIIEFHRMGASVKVSAFDPKSMTEVSMVGPATAGETELTRAVLKKLQYVINKRND